ncbi:acetoacetate--CoA ligase, partial [Vibrio makurazakiensis]|uniref:acetoacetate--CoA ligase n=1 Tax=Vibrio makurazakiensis TaxID=2910250 RepID=UPI003D0F1FB8
MHSLSPIWSPTPSRIEHSIMFKFIKYLRDQQVYVEDFQQLHRWSVDNNALFWDKAWDFCHLQGSKKGPITGDGRAKWQHYSKNRDTQWFAESKLNYAENLLTYSTQTPDEQAIIFSNESGESRNMTWDELHQQVAAVQQWLQEQGVCKGDVVAGYLPHIPETLVAMLATTSLGVIWTSTSPDFGIESVVERFEQVSPKVFFCCNGYAFNGKAFDMRAKNKAITARLPSLNAHCEIPYTANVPLSESTINWNDILDKPTTAPLKFERINFNEPLFILYSSGTTGKPKCIVHSVGGTLLNHLKEHQLHCDVKPHDRVFYYTTCGWMMWNWHVSALASGATLVIYDGSPVYPKTSVLWDLAEHNKVTLFGTSAKYLEALHKAEYSPIAHHDLTSLKTLCSTGSVLYPEQFDFVYQDIKQDLHLASISGGTDICGCFVLGNPISPVFRGECQGSGLGLDVQVISEQTTELEPTATKEHMVIEERGELVCANSFPNQPIGFWNDDGAKYHNAYWNKYDGIWHHGDDVIQTKNGGMLFYGRSDTTLNPGGVRIGTGEIYRQVNGLPEIIDSIAVGKIEGQDESIVL